MKRLTSLLVLTLLAALLVAWPAPTLYNEAPMLAELVEAGELPPVEYRLPKKPKVFPVYGEIGKYGGTLNLAYKGAGIGDKWNVEKFINRGKPIEWYMPDADTINIIENWSDGFEVSPDGSEFTFHIREGMKWSDGVPVTTEDVQFWYEVMTYDPPPPGVGSHLFQEGKFLEIEIVDDYTFKVKFPKPNPFFLQAVAKESSGSPGIDRAGFMFPKHYLKDYHPLYASKAQLEKVLAEYGLSEWTELWHYGPIQMSLLNPDLPVITPWKVVQPPGGQQIVYERNPYFWAVDEAGNQLPYIDQVVFHAIEDIETLPLLAAQGKIDFQGRHINLADYTFYKENEEKGGYRVVLWKTASTMAIMPNQAAPDPVVRELLQTPEFREALSIAIDREEVNEIAYSGLGEARQASPVSGSPFFDPEFEAKWAEYDPDRANQLLDELGLDQRDSDGFRLRPDGKRLQLTLTYPNVLPSDPMELLITYWKDIGINLQVKAVERTLYEQMRSGGELELGYWAHDRDVIVSADPARYVGYGNETMDWATLYGVWYLTDGEEGLEPPPDHPIRKTVALWQEAQSAASPEEGMAKVLAMIGIHKEAPLVIGFVGEMPTLYIVDVNLGNVPPFPMVHDDVLRGAGLAQPIQFYWKE